MSDLWYAGLSREDRERLATELYGPRPPEREGYTLYAKFHRTGATEGFVWIYRRKSHPCDQRRGKPSRSGAITRR